MVLKYFAPMGQYKVWTIAWSICWLKLTRFRPIKNCDKRVNGYLTPTEILNFSKYGKVVRQCYFDI